MKVAIKEKARTFIQTKVLSAITTFVNFTPMKAIANGMLRLIPFTIVGSIFLIIWNFPILPIQNLLTDIGWRDYLLKAFNSSGGIVAWFAVISIAYSYAQLKEVEPMSAGGCALVAFVMISPLYMKNGDTLVTGAFNMTWAGSQGLIGAIIMGVFVGWLYSYLILHDIRFKMPKEVPEGVTNAFNALIPYAVTGVITFFIYSICDKFGTTLLDLIYNLLQIPLQNVTNNFGVIILSAFIIHLLWWFGIHGGAINSATFGPLQTANLQHNAELMASGIAVTAANGAAYFTDTFNFSFIIMSGSGITIGMVIYMMFFAKSKTFKALGKLSIIPSIFEINEPIIFGTPIVFNPYLFIPFIGVPIIGASLAYFCMRFGIIPLSHGISAPSLTPPIINGLINGGWKWAALQGVILVLSIVIYFPFMRKADQAQCEKEEREEQEQE